MCHLFRFLRFVPGLAAGMALTLGLASAVAATPAESPTLQRQIDQLNRANAAVVGLRVAVADDASSAETLGRTRSGSGVVIDTSGLILTIGQWVLEQSCFVLRSWADRHPDNTLSISVNLSARQFSSPDLVQNLFDCIRTNGVNPAQLKLEITESDVMTNPEATIQKLRLMKELGVSILVDDFGTGYSSMSYLQRFPIDTLKIDRSFVKDINGNGNHPIVSAIAGIARGFDIQLAAEGVERGEQMNTLENLGCDEMQGFLFSRPVDAEAATRLLNHFRPSSAARSLAPAAS